MLPLWIFFTAGTAAAKHTENVLVIGSQYVTDNIQSFMLFHFYLAKN